MSSEWSAVIDIRGENAHRWRKEHEAGTGPAYQQFDLVIPGYMPPHPTGSQHNVTTRSDCTQQLKEHHGGIDYAQPNPTMPQRC